MNQHQLITAYKAMLYVAREENYAIHEKYEELEELLIQNYDYDVTDMFDNMEVIYNQLKEIV